MPSPPRVYLHVGAPKTGTTYVQGVLWANRETLAQRGVWLPGGQPNDHFRAGFDLRGLEQERDDPREGWDGLWDRTAAQVRNASSDVVVLSDERLAACSIDQVRRAADSLAPAEVHAVYTVRDFSQLLPAEWQEHVKAGDKRTFEKWLADVLGNRGKNWFWQVHDVVDVLHRWNSALPRERLHLVTLPRPGTRPELLWERFASVLGIDPGDVNTEVRANASLGTEGAELLRRVNEALPQDFPVWHRVELVREVLAHRVLATRSDKTPITVPPDWSDWVAEYSKQVVRDLEGSEYQVTGDLGELIPDGARGQSVHRPDTTQAAADSIAGLLAWMGRIRDERRRVRRKLADVRAERDALREVAAQPETVSRDDGEPTPAEIIKRTVVELGQHWRPVGIALRGWRRIKGP